MHVLQQKSSNKCWPQDSGDTHQIHNPAKYTDSKTMYVPDCCRRRRLSAKKKNSSLLRHVWTGGALQFCATWLKLHMQSACIRLTTQMNDLQKNEEEMSSSSVERVSDEHRMIWCFICRAANAEFAAPVERTLQRNCAGSARLKRSVLPLSMQSVSLRRRFTYWLPHTHSIALTDRQQTSFQRQPKPRCSRLVECRHTDTSWPATQRRINGILLLDKDAFASVKLGDWKAKHMQSRTVAWHANWYTRLSAESTGSACNESWIIISVPLTVCTIYNC